MKKEEVINRIIVKLKNEGVTKSNYRRIDAYSFLSMCVIHTKLALILLENEDYIISKLD